VVVVMVVVMMITVSKHLILGLTLLSIEHAKLVFVMIQEGLLQFHHFLLHTCTTRS